MNAQPSYPWLAQYPTAVKWDQPVPERAVPDILAETVRLYGDRPGFDFMGKKYTWAQVGDLVDRMAKGLQGMGVVKGTRVGLFLPNCPFFVISYYAVLKAGGTVVNLNPLYATKELQHLIEDSGAEIVVTANLAMLYDKIHDVLHVTGLRKLVMCKFAGVLPFPKNILFPLVKAKDIAKIQHKGEHLWFHDIIKNDGKPKPVAINPREDVAVLQYTGGTTGVPKGAMLTHANVSANVEQSSMWFHACKRGQEKMLGVLPFFHVFAMTAVMNMSVRNALELIMLPRFELDATLKLIDGKKPHYFPAVPAIYNAINNHPKLKEFDLTSLRYCISGGAPLPVEVKKTFEANTGCVVVEGYGLTESSPVVCANPITGVNKAGSIGQPVPGTIVEIINPEDKKTPVPRGERGELCVRGPQVMKGYWRKPDDSASVLTDGRLYTGDVAIMDEDGYVFIVDRIKDMIITNGYKVYPRNVEEAIYAHDAVEECIVAGIADENRGEIVKAWIKPKAGRSLATDELKDFLKNRISPMEIPKQIEVRQEPLPKTIIGKLSRKDVLAQEKAAG